MPMQPGLYLAHIFSDMSGCMRNRLFAYAKTKTQISFAVSAKLISAFVFATWIIKSLFFLDPKFQASSYLLWPYSLVCVGPGLKPRRPVFSQRGSNKNGCITTSRIWVFCPIKIQISLHAGHPPSLISLHCLQEESLNEPHHEKTCLRGFREGVTQSGLYSHRRWLEA